MWFLLARGIRFASTFHKFIMFTFVVMGNRHCFYFKLTFHREKQVKDRELSDLFTVKEMQYWFCFCTDPSCKSLECKFYSYCTVPPSGIATCKCPDPAACGNSRNRVCGTDALSYDNICHLTAAACKRYHEVRVLHAGLCIREFCVCHDVG